MVRPHELSRSFVDDAYGEAAAFAQDYELLRFEGHTPVELLPPTSGRSTTPLDDLTSDEVSPRGPTRRTINSGHRLRRVIARHRETGELAGHTVVAVDAETPQLAHQHDTAVVRAHLGYVRVSRQLEFQKRI